MDLSIIAQFVQGLLDQIGWGSARRKPLSELTKWCSNSCEIMNSMHRLSTRARNKQTTPSEISQRGRIILITEYVSVALTDKN